MKFTNEYDFGAWVNRLLHWNFSSLITDLLAQQSEPIVTWEDIENYPPLLSLDELQMQNPEEWADFVSTFDEDDPMSDYDQNELREQFVRMFDNIDPYDEDQEVFEWWLVDSWLFSKLKEYGEPVLETKHGDMFWGRCGTGYALGDEAVLREIYAATYPNEVVNADETSN